MNRFQFEIQWIISDVKKRIADAVNDNQVSISLVSS